MSEELPDAESEREFRFQELGSRVDANHDEIEELARGARRVNHRASTSEETTAEQGHRITQLEVRAEIDRELIAQLQADGLLAMEHAAHLEEALRSARLIGTAMGIVMADQKLTEADAFTILKKASQRTNRKLRVLAEELVRTGDLSGRAPGVTNSRAALADLNLSTTRALGCFEPTRCPGPIRRRAPLKAVRVRPPSTRPATIGLG